MNLSLLTVTLTTALILTTRLTTGVLLSLKHGMICGIMDSAPFQSITAMLHGFRRRAGVSDRLIKSGS